MRKNPGRKERRQSERMVRRKGDRDRKSHRKMRTKMGMNKPK